MTTMKMDIGGAETHILEVAKELTSRGVEVVVASSGGVYTEELARAGIRHIEAPMHSKNLFLLWKAYRILSRLLKHESFDLIHSHARIPAFISYHLSNRFHIRMVSTAHLTFHVNGLWRRLSHWGEQTLAVSEDIKQYLIDEYSVCSGNIGVTVNGIDMKKFHPDIDGAEKRAEFSIPDDCRCIVHVSRMDEDRCEAAFRLVSIAPELVRRYPDAVLLLVGSGRSFVRLRAAADTANRIIGHTAVHLAGARTDIAELIACGDIFVGVSRAALEAMAMGKPCVVGGNEGYLGIYSEELFQTAYNTNFCCRGCDQIEDEKLLNDLCTLLSLSTEERLQSGEACRKTVEEHYSLQRMADDYQMMYERAKPYAYYEYGDVILSGYYGFHNIGDDSLLRLILDNLRSADETVRITALTHKPEQARLTYGVKCVNRSNPFAVVRAMRHARMLITGGGNLLQDKTSRRSIVYYSFLIKLAHHFGLKQMIYANGIGPLNHEESRDRAREALNLVDLITLREPESRHLVEKLGIDASKVRLTADPTFLLPPPDEQWISHLRNRFGLNGPGEYFCFAPRTFRHKPAANAEAVASVCERIAEQYHLTPVLIPMQAPNDLKVAKQIAKHIKGEYRIVTGVTGSELKGILAGMQFIFSMRLHTLIYGASVGVPIIGIAYDRKIDAFLSYIGVSPALPEEADGREEMYFSAASRIMVCREETCHTILESRAMMQGLAREDAKAALALLHSSYQEEKKSADNS